MRNGNGYDGMSFLKECMWCLTESNVTYQAQLGGQCAATRVNRSVCKDYDSEPQHQQ